jgi:hypothetical protein
MATDERRSPLIQHGKNSMIRDKLSDDVFDEDDLTLGCKRCALAAKR